MAHNKILAILNDLMFIVNIQDAARRAGFEAVFAKNSEEVFAKASDEPLLIVLDLHAGCVAPLEIIVQLKASPATAKIPILSYVSHVDVETNSAAQRAGSDAVVPRSAFSQNLPALLQRYAMPAA